MATLRSIQRRIVGVKNTRKITQAMRMVSAAKLRRAQEAIWSARPYVEKLGEIMADLVQYAGEDYTHPLIKRPKEVKNVVCIVVAGDRGLCGSFNTNLFRYSVRTIEDVLKKDYPEAQFHIIPVGKSTCTFFKKRDYPIVKQYPGIFGKLEFSSAKEIVDLAKEGFVGDVYDKVVVFNNFFKNVLTQMPTHGTLLPIEPPQALADDEDEKKPKKEESKFEMNYIYEPNQKEILDELLPKNLNVQLWKALLESNAAEQAARMTAMENATNNAKDLIDSLQLKYNKARQSVITTEMLEIVSGANALSKG